MCQFELSDGLCLGVVLEGSILVLLGEVSVVAFVVFPWMFHVQGRGVSFLGFFGCVLWLSIDDVWVVVSLLSDCSFGSDDSERSFSGFFHCAP